MQQILAISLLKALRERGADRIFGIPGDFVLPFFRIIEESGILPLHTLSHEPGVGYAADAVGRIRSSLGVAVVTYGAGALNMVNAVAQAYAEKSPLVVISGGPGLQEGQAGLYLHHQVKNLTSQFRIFQELTCDQAILDDPARAPEQIARVLDNALKFSRPVYIEIPRDLTHAPCAPVPDFIPAVVDMQAARACAAEIMERLKAARNPALLAGVEVRRYNLEAKLSDLCRSLSLPVATTFMGHGLLAAQDCPLMGTYLGAAGDEAVAHCIEQADALLMLGVIVSDTNFGVSGRNIDMRNAIHAFDHQVSFSYHRYPDLSLEALIDALQEIAEPLGKAGKALPSDYIRGLPDDDTPLKPSHVAMAVNDLFARHGRMPIASDIGDCLFTGLEIENTEFIAPGYYASMGFGVPAGLALQAATGRRPIILVGDGAFQMTGWELGNCRRYGFSPIVVLFNNRSWEMLRAFQPGPRYHDLDDWHYADMAAPLGGRGMRAHSCGELQRALESAWQDDSCFQLIEVMLDRGVTSQMLARFTGAVKNLSALKDE